MPTHPIYGNYLATYTPMVGVSIGAPITIGDYDPLLTNPVFYVDASSSMLGALEAPILDIDPSNASSLDIITASRTGTATYTDLSGNIQLADPNTVRVDHLQGEELTPTTDQLVPYTDFSSGWSNSEIVSGYDSSAGLYYEADNPFSFFSIDIPVQSGVTYRLSYWAKSSTQTGIIYMYHGFVTTNQTPLDSISNEWQYFEFDITSDFTGNMRFGARFQFAGDNITISKPSIRTIGLDNPEFISNTTGSPKTLSVTYAPRVPMMLIEPAATNLITNSNTFFSSGTTVIDGTDYLAPDGTNTATQVSNILDAAGDRATISSAPVVGDTEYSGSIFVKGTAGEKISFYTKRADGSTYAGSLYTQVVLTGKWQRVTNLTYTTASDNTFGSLKLTNVTNATADVVQIWGAQFEEGSISTSYIPTAGSAVTRNRDDLVIDGSDFTNFYNTSEGTFYVEAALNKDSDGTQNWLLGSGSSQARFLYQHGNGNRLLCYDGATVLGAGSSTQHTTGEIFRAAISYDATNLTMAVDGESMGVGSHNGNFGTLPTALYIGGRGAANYNANVHFKRILYWPLYSDNL